MEYYIIEDNERVNFLNTFCCLRKLKRYLRKIKTKACADCKKEDRKKYEEKMIKNNEKRIKKCRRCGAKCFGDLCMACRKNKKKHKYRW